MFVRRFTAGLLSLLTFYANAAIIDDGYAFSVLGEPKYIYNFNHFDYVNPAAPKGGSITLAAIGSFNSFNHFASQGHPAVGSETLDDSLFTPSSDEVGSYYPLIADSARYDSQFKWLEVEINPRARFQDGSPITAQDVAFTFKTLMTEGAPQDRETYKGVVVKAISRLTVRFEFHRPDREQMLGLLALPIVSKKFWLQHKLNRMIATPPLSSGPYRISQYKLGQYVVYSRVPDYWAANLPVNRGRYNFDTIRYNYYPNQQAALAAFKSGHVDLIQEDSPKNWATQYQGSPFSKGFIVKRDEINQAAQNTRWLAFNVQRPLFKDRRVREALTLAFNFNMINRSLFYNTYQRTTSYFQNTEYAATHYPDSAELAWLAPLKSAVPDEVFSHLYRPPQAESNNANLVKAAQLLKQAGWEKKDRQLVNDISGKAFTFELIIPSDADAVYLKFFQDNLLRLGIHMNIKQLDGLQFTKRAHEHDYDMIPVVYKAQPYPGKNLLLLWNSKYTNAAENMSNVANPAIDTLTREIAANQGKPAALLPLGHALDRVLTWNMLMIPLWYSERDRYAYWDKFSAPNNGPYFTLQLDTWWFDVNKAARLPAEYH
ncbi:extracellular solute-binding protein [Rouxiella sp. Mn2063]|uniref:extracellular solute-binding protein n=1 Tax=Rouxiella sp. Mn2063 TaxID=3395262 RepID=UPI003BBE420F